MNLIKKYWPIGLLIVFTVIFFYPFFFKGLLPIPADILPGVYYPWHDIGYQGLPAGVPVKNALPSDIISLTYPLRLLSINLLKSGEWPLWNPYILSGTPLLANFQSAALNPLNILYFLTGNFSLIWSFQILLQPFLASLFLYLFLRSQKLSKGAALYGSFIWGFGGFVGIWAGYNTVIHAILTLPLALWAVWSIKDNVWSGPALSFSVFYSIVSGNPPMTVILLITSGLYAVWVYDNDWKKYFRALIFVIFGVALSAPLLLTGLNVMNASIRDVDTIAFTAGIKYLPVFKLITFIAPDFFGNPATLNVWKQAGLYDNLTVYLGAIPFMLFISSFFHFYLGEKRRLIHFFWFLFAFSLLLAIKNPVSAYVGNLPVLGLSAMVMTRFTVLSGLSIAVCSAIIIDELLSGRSKFVNWRASLIFSLGIIIIFLIMTQGVGFLAAKELPHLIFDGQKILQDLISFARTAFRNSVIPIGLIFSSFITLMLLLLWPGQAFKKGGWPRLLAVIFLSSLTFFEFFRFYHKYNTFTHKEYLYPQTPITDFLATQSGRFARENGEVIPSNTWMPYNLKSASGYDTLHSLRYNQFLSLVAGNHLTDTSSRYAEIKDFNNQFFNYLGVTHIVTIKRKSGVPDPGGEISYIFPDNLYPRVTEWGKTAILGNPRSFPLIYSVDNYLVSKSTDETEKELLSIDLHNTAVLEDDPGLSNLSKADLYKISIEDQKTTFDVTSPTGTLIVTSISFSDGWHLKVDGNETPIFVVNHAFIGFSVPAGAHFVEFVYHPHEFDLGLIVSAFSLVLLLLYNKINYR